MDDYIKREDAIEEIRKNFDQSKTGKSILKSTLIDAAFLQARSILQNISAADVRKNVRGNWIYQNPLFVDTIMCSVCGYNLPSDDFKTNFCAYCGADMRGDKE